MKLNGVELTPETVAATRKWFADNAAACIEEAKSGAVQVNDLEAYRAWKQQSARAALAGEYDHTLTFLQRAYFIQTGESVPLLGS